MTKFLLRWAINAVAIYLAVLIVPGIELQGDWTSVIWLALISGLINALLRPLLMFLTCPLILATLGVFALMVNTFLFWLTGQIGRSFGVGLYIDDFMSAFLGGLVITIVSVILNLILKDELKGRRKK
jgi:putative membrane protein